ncbi:unnamed protein product, partial [Allacma fusca]
EYIATTLRFKELYFIKGKDFVDKPGMRGLWYAGIKLGFTQVESHDGNTAYKVPAAGRNILKGSQFVSQNSVDRFLLGFSKL